MIAEVVDDALRMRAAGVADVGFEQILQMRAVVLETFGVDAQDVDEFVVVAIDEIAVAIQHVGHAAGEAGAEVQAGAAEHRDHAAGHVFAAVIARAFDHRERAGIAHREAFAGAARGVQFAAGGAVEAGVAEDGRFVGDVARVARRTDDDAAVGHALADVIVGFAFEFQLQAAGEERAEALPGAAVEMQGDGRIAHAVVAVRARDAAGQARADAAVGVADDVAQRRVEGLAAALVGDGVGQVVFELRGEAGRRRLRRAHAAVAARSQTFVREERRQIQQAMHGQGAFGLVQQFGAADDLFDRTRAQLRQITAYFLGEAAEKVLDAFGQAGEVVGAQFVVLRGDAGGAVVEMADAQVFAAQRDHRRGAEAEGLGAEQCGLDHVQAGLHAAVGLHDHAVAQTVGDQRLACFGQAQFPRRAGVADRRDGAGTGAAVVAGNGDEIGAGFRDARSDRADAGMRDQLHRDQRVGIDLAQIEDQLREIFDRIDVVMRRRRDQADARPRVTQARDEFVDLVAGQLAAFAGLGALRDLDLQHFGVDQIFGRHAEAAGGDLLDLRDLAGAVAQRVFAAFAGIAAAAEAVHRDRQRFVRFGRQGAEAHRRGVETFDDGFDRLHVVERDGGRLRGVEREQIAQRRGRARVHRVGVGVPVVARAAAHRALQRGDHVGVVLVVFAVRRVLQQAADVRQHVVVPGAGRDMRGFFLQRCERGAADPRRRAGEAQVDDLAIQADDLEQLRAAIAADGGDAHLRDDLEQAFLDAAPVAAADLRDFAVLGPEDAAFAEVVQGLVGEIRIHRGGAVADQACEMMRIARGAGFDDEIGAAAQADADQMLMHRAGGEQRVHQQMIATRAAVADDQQFHAGAGCGFGVRAQAQQRRAQAFFGGEIQIEIAVRIAEFRQQQQLPLLALRQHRRVQHHVPHLVRAVDEQIAFLADLGGERHHAVFAQ